MDDSELKSQFSRRHLLGGVLAGAAGARIARGQQGCEAPLPSNTFGGVIGRTAADSTPSPLEIPQAPEGSPNVIYIILDDTGFSDFHCYGSEAATPNIDALAAGGLFYNNFRSKAVCAPSRASLLTGRNSHAVGMKELPGRDQGYPHSRGRVTPAAAMVSQILSANGYRTMGVGKWHLTPDSDMNASGARTHWPLQKGFDRWYGFLSGWTDQYNPSGVGREIIEDNHAIERPDTPGYHFSVDIIDRAIQMIGNHVSAAAAGGRGSGPGGSSQGGKPFFLHTAFGAAHAPVQVPREYIEKYVSVYSKGWDQIRAERYERQLAMGVIPEGTQLPPRNPGDPAWDELSERERTVFSRFMAAYAGFIEHTDEQIGRLVAYLKEQDLFDNTAIFLMTDNGGAPEAGVRGSFDRPYGGRYSVDEMYEHLDELGTENSQPLYQRPWAGASDTPFKFYKLWPYRGGVQTPLVVSWPNQIQGQGLRGQFVDIIDITPTVLDIAGVEAPAVHNGVCQIPLHGKSIRDTFDNPDSPNPRDVQYFELWGSRGIWHDGWDAIGIHRPGTDYDTDRWELYHSDVDFSQSTDLAASNPGKLEEMKKLWWSEAEKNGALPLLEAGFRGNTYNQALD